MREPTIGPDLRPNRDLLNCGKPWVMFDDPNVPTIDSNVKRYEFDVSYLKDLRTIIVEFYRERYRIELTKYLAPYSILSDELNDHYYAGKEVFNGRYLWRLVNKNVGKKPSVERILRIVDYIQNRRWVKPEVDSHYVREIKNFISSIDGLLVSGGFRRVAELYDIYKARKFDADEAYYRCMMIWHFGNHAIYSDYDLETLDADLEYAMSYFNRNKQARNANNCKVLLSIARHLANRFAESEKLLSEYIEYAIETGYQIGEAIGYGTKASLLLMYGDYHTSIRWSDECIRIAEILRLSDNDEEVSNGFHYSTKCWVNKGKAYQHLGKAADARIAYAQAVPGLRQIGDQRELGVTLLNLANMQGLTGGSKEECSATLNEAFNIFTKLEMDEMLSQCIDLQSRLEVNYGDDNAAYKILVEYYNKKKDSDDIYIVADFISRIAGWHYRRKSSQAIKWYKRLIEYCASKDISSYRFFTGIAHSVIGELLTMENKKRDAEIYFNKAVAEYNRYLENCTLESACRVYGRLGDLYTYWNKVDEAVRQYHRAFLISSSTGNTRHMAINAIIIGQKLVRLNYSEKALIYLSAASSQLFDTDFHDLRVQCDLALSECYISYDKELCLKFLNRAKEINDLHSTGLQNEIVAVENKIASLI